MKKIILFFVVLACTSLFKCANQVELQPKPVLSIADIAAMSFLQANSGGRVTNEMSVSIQEADLKLKKYVDAQLKKKIIVTASCCASCLPECCQCGETFMFVGPIKSMQLVPSAGGDPIQFKIEDIGEGKVYSLTGKVPNGKYTFILRGNFIENEYKFNVLSEEGTFKLAR